VIHLRIQLIYLGIKVLLLFTYFLAVLILKLLNHDVLLLQLPDSLLNLGHFSHQLPASALKLLPLSENVVVGCPTVTQLDFQRMELVLNVCLDRLLLVFPALKVLIIVFEFYVFGFGLVKYAKYINKLVDLIDNQPLVLSPSIETVDDLVLSHSS
jgi:hypothetical protein